MNAKHNDLQEDPALPSPGQNHPGTADEVGASDTYIRKLEAGDRLPSLDMLIKLSKALDTTPNHLLLSASTLGKNLGSSIHDLLSDCTPSEFVILYENMAHLKGLLREQMK